MDLKGRKRRWKQLEWWRLQWRILKQKQWVVRGKWLGFTQIFLKIRAKLKSVRRCRASYRYPSKIRPQTIDSSWAKTWNVYFPINDLWRSYRFNLRKSLTKKIKRKRRQMNKTATNQIELFKSRMKFKIKRYYYMLETC